MRKHSLINLFLFLFSSLHTQDTLTLQQAIALALQNNYAINISKSETEIASNNVSPGNAGMLPVISLYADGGFSGNDTKQEFIDGRVVDKKNAQSNNIGSGIALNWLVFDGLKMFIRYDKLKELNKQSEFASRIQIENTMVEVISAYYEIVRQKQLLKVNERLIGIYDERVNVSKTRWDVGKAAKTDYLQAQLDYNAEKAARIKLASALTDLKTKLNQVLARQPELDFEVSEAIDVDMNLKLDALADATMRMNNSLLFFQSNIAINEYSLREFRAERLPEVFLNATYDFSKTNNQAGFLLFNRNLGWNVGLSASWNLFNGFNTRREIKNAQINLKIAQLELDNIRSTVQSSLYASYKKYQSALEALVLEEENTTLAKENMDIIMESFRLGRANTLEFKEAQRSYEDALTNSLQTRYDAKVAETELLRLKGELVR
jgi:outer membrane protein